MELPKRIAIYTARGLRTLETDLIFEIISLNIINGKLF